MGMTLGEKIIARAAGVDFVKQPYLYLQSLDFSIYYGTYQQSDVLYHHYSS